MRDLAERAEIQFTGERQLEWFSALELEHENVRAALDRAERASDPDEVATGLRTAAALWRFWQQRGHLAEGRARLVRLLALPGAEGRNASRSLALGALGSIDYWLNDYDPMQESYEEAASIAEELGDRRLLGRSMFNLAFVPFVRGHPERAVKLQERCLQIADPDDHPLLARIWSSIGAGRMFAGDPQGAIAPIEHALELFRSADEQLASCEVLILLSGAHLRLGDVETALARLDEATAIATKSASPLLVANAVLPHSLAANRMGRYERAARLVGAWNRLEQDHEIHFPAAGLGFFGDPAADARAGLGDAAFERARMEGFVMNLQEIIELIEEDPEQASP